MKASVFNGDVVERVVETPLQMSIAKKIGQPSPMSTWRGKSLGAVAALAKPTYPSFSATDINQNQIFPTIGRENDRKPLDDNDKNLEILKSMSAKDLADAENEIKSMLKPETMALLRKMAEKKSGAINCSDIPITQCLKPSTDEGTKIASSECGSTSSIIKQRGIDRGSAGKIPKPILSTRKLMRSQTDRFDLRGRKVIQRDLCTSEVAAALGEHSLFGSWNLSKNDIDSIAAMCVDSMLAVDFAVEHKPLDDSQPQDELLNHQMESDQPGYNMTEACEFYRCENPSQRLLGLNILIGVLQRRDRAVALEAYSGIRTLDSYPYEEELSEFEKLQLAFEKIFRFTVTVAARSLSLSSCSDSESCSGTEEHSSLPSIWEERLMRPDESANIRRILVYVLLIMCASDLPTGLPTLLVWGIKLPRLPPVLAVPTLRLLREYMSSAPEEHAAEQLWNGFWGTSGCPSLPMPHCRRAETTYEEHVEACFDNRRNVLEEEQKALQGEGEGEGKGVVRPPMFETFAMQCRWGRVDAVVGEGVVNVLCANIAAGAAVLSHEREKEAGRVAVTGRERDKERDGACVLALQTASISLEILHSICRLCDKHQVATITVQVIKIWRSCLSLLEGDDVSVAGDVSGGSLRGCICCGWWKVLTEMCRRSRDFALWLCEDGRHSIIAKCSVHLLMSTEEHFSSSSSSLHDVHALNNDSVGVNDSDHIDVTVGSGALSSKYVTATLLSQRLSWDSVVWCLRLWRVCAAYGEGLTAVSELLLAAQLQGNSLSVKRCERGPDTNTHDTLLAAVAKAIGPGMLARAGSLRRVTAVLWLLEQSAVTCAAIVDMNTIRATSKEKESAEGMTEERTEGKMEEKRLSAVTPAALAKELEEDERVGRALETARLLLGVAERLVPVIQSVAEAEEGTVTDSAPDAVIMIAAARNFLASVLGAKQASLGSDRESCTDADPASLMSLMGYSLRQHTAGIGASTINSNSSGGDSGRGIGRGRSAGKGMLQSCTSYAQYVRTASAHQHISDDSETNTNANEIAAVGSTTADDVTIPPLPVPPTRRPQYQFAALHHLESSINSFIEIHITSRLLNALHQHTSLSLNSHALHGDSAFSEWVKQEDLLSNARLFSNALSFYQPKTNAPTGGCDEVPGVSHSAVYLSAVERVSSRATVRPTAVCAGLYAWQCNRLSQCLLLLDLQLACKGHSVGVVSVSSLSAACLKSLVSMGQGMKEPIARVARLALDLTDYMITGGLRRDITENKTLKKQSALPLNKIPFSPPSDVAATDHTSSACPTIGIDEELRSVLLGHLLGSEEDVNKALNFSDFSVLIQREDQDNPYRPLNMADWKDACIDTAIPVPADWALQSLKKMEGVHFERWLDVLSAPSVSGSQEGSVKREGGEGDYLPLLPSAVDSLYGLLLLSCPDQAFRWRILTADTNAAAEDVEGEWDCMVVNDCSEKSVSAYCALLGNCAERIGREKMTAESRSGGVSRKREGKGEGESATSHCEQFIAVSLKGVSSTHALASSVKNCGNAFSQAARAREGKSTFGAGVKAEAGVMDLCDKLLEALTSQVISQDVHCASVLCLLSPTLSPWRVREKVWRELGQLRLLHLIESEVIIDSVLGLMDCIAVTLLQRDSCRMVHASSGRGGEQCSAVSGAGVHTHADAGVDVGERCVEKATTHSNSSISNNNSNSNNTPRNSSSSSSGSNSKNRSACPGPLKTMMLVSKAILDALCHLRSEEDKHWHIVSLGLYQVAASLFSVSSREVVQGRVLLIANIAQGRMLVDVLQDLSVPDWAVTGVVLAAHCFFSNNTPHTGISDEGLGGGFGGVGVEVMSDLEMLQKGFCRYRQQRRLVDDNSCGSPLRLIGADDLASSITPPCSLFIDEVLISFPKTDSEGKGEKEGRAVSLRDVIATYRPHLV